MTKEKKIGKAKINIDKFIGTPDELEFVGMADNMEVLKPETAIKSSDVGPQYDKDSPFTARMRFHQSWYRANVLGVSWGTGPGPNSTRELGSMLTRESGTKGLNFLTPQIFKVAKARLKDARGTVDEYRLLHNMLSSQPMCFNLLGPLVLDHNLATLIFKLILPGEVKEVVKTKIEFAPEPTCEYLNDQTAFDTFVEFARPDGSKGFIGIETKLTEPFSNRHYDSPVYRRWTELPNSPWPKESWDRLDNISHNQLWRDHLLSVALRHHPKSLYAYGLLMLVRHPEDRQCAKIAHNYSKLLKTEDNSFLDYPLNKIVDIMESGLQKTCHKSWLVDFRKRYIDLSGSEEEWRHRTIK